MADAKGRRLKKEYSKNASTQGVKVREHCKLPPLTANSKNELVCSSDSETPQLPKLSTDDTSKVKHGVKTSPTKRGKQASRRARGRVLPGISKKQTPYERKCWDDLDDSVKEVLGMTETPSTPPAIRSVLLNTEQQLCSEFQWACLQDDCPRQVGVLCKLAEVFSQRGCSRKCPGDISNACALLNAALALNVDLYKDKVIQQKLALLEHDLFKSFSLQPSKNVSEQMSMNAGKFKNRLKKIRTSTASAVQRINSSCENIFMSDDDDVVRGQKETVIKDMKVLLENTQQHMIKFFKSLVTSSCELFSDRAQTEFALVAVGDLASGAASPYMNLEFVILTKNRPNAETLQFLGELVNVLHIRIIGLGETPLHYVDVNMIRDIQKNTHSSRLLFDSKTKNGLKIPSNKLKGIVTPVPIVESADGSTASSTTYICSSQELADHVSELAQSGSDIMKCVKLLQPILLYGPQNLLDEYIVCVSTVLEQVKDGNHRLSTLFSTSGFIKLVQLCSLDIELYNKHLWFDQPYNLLLEMDWYPYLIVLLKLAFGASSLKPWDIISELKSKLHISENGEHHLKAALIIAQYLKLANNIRFKGLDWTRGSFQELLQIQKKNMLCHYLFGLSTEFIVLQFYTVFTPLLTSLKCFRNTRKMPNLLHPTYGKKSTETLVNFFIRTLQFDLAKQTLKVAVEGIIPSQEKCEYCRIIALLAMHENNIKEANIYLGQVMEYKECIDNTDLKLTVFLRTWHDFGLVHMLENKLDKAEKYFLECIDMYQEMGNGSESAIFILVYISLGTVMSLRGVPEQALVFYSKALVLLSKWKDDPFVLKGTVLCINREIGLLYKQLSNFKLSLPWLEKAIDLKTEMCNPGIPNMEILFLWNMVCQLMQDLAKSSVSQGMQLSCHALAEHIHFTRSGNQNMIDASKQIPRLPGVFESSAVLVSCLHPQTYQKQILSVYSSVIEGQRDHASNAASIAENHQRMGLAYVEANQIEDAVGSFQSCYDTLKKSFVVEKKYGALGKCRSLYGMGMALSMKETKYKEKALVPLCESQKWGNLAHGTESNTDNIKIMMLMGKVYAEIGSYAKAIDTMKTTLEMAECLECPTLRIVHIHQSLALVYRDIDDYKNTLLHLTDAQNILDKVFGKNACVEDIAHNVTYIGQTYKLLGNLERAERYMKQAVHQWKFLYPGKFHLPVVIKAYVELGNTLRSQKIYDEAITCHKEIVEVLKSHGTVPPMTMANVVAELAIDYSLCGLYIDAARSWQCAIDAKCKAVGEWAPDNTTINWHTQLAKCHEALGNSEKVLEISAHILQLQKLVMERQAEDKGVITSLMHLANHHETKGEYRKAVHVRRKTLQKLLDIHGEDVPHPEIAFAINSLAHTYWELGEYGASLAYQNKHLNLLTSQCQQENKSSETVEIASSMKKIASVHEKLGNFAQAITLYDRVTQMTIRIKGGCENIEVANCLCSLGKAYHAVCDSEKAVETLKRAQAIVKGLEKHWLHQAELATIVFTLGLSYESKFDFPKATQCHQEALKLRTILSKDEPSEAMAASLRALGRTYSLSGKHEKAVQMLEESVKMYQVVMGGTAVTEELANIVEDLGAAYSCAQIYGKAVECYSRQLRMHHQILGYDKASLKIARCMSLLATAQRDAKLLDESLSSANQALGMYSTILRSITDHPAISALWELQGDVHMETGDYSQAVKCYKRASIMMLTLHNNDALQAAVVAGMQKLRRAQNLAAATE